MARSHPRRGNSPPGAMDSHSAAIRPQGAAGTPQGINHKQPLNQQPHKIKYYAIWKAVHPAQNSLTPFEGTLYAEIVRPFKPPIQALKRHIKTIGG